MTPAAFWSNKKRGVGVGEGCEKQRRTFLERKGSKHAVWMGSDEGKERAGCGGSVGCGRTHLLVEKRGWPKNPYPGWSKHRQRWRSARARRCFQPAQSVKPDFRVVASVAIQQSLSSHSQQFRRRKLNEYNKKDGSPKHRCAVGGVCAQYRFVACHREGEGDESSARGG